MPKSSSAKETLERASEEFLDVLEYPSEDPQRIL